MAQAKAPIGPQAERNRTTYGQELRRFLIWNPIYYGVGFFVCIAIINLSKGAEFIELTVDWVLPRLILLVFISIVISYSVHWREIFVLIRNRPRKPPAD